MERTSIEREPQPSFLALCFDCDKLLGIYESEKVAEIIAQGHCEASGHSTMVRQPITDDEILDYKWQEYQESVNT